MVKRVSFLLALGWVFINAGPLLAHPWLVGFSGAPGTYGSCSRSCHGYPGGTIYVDRFPAQYRPGQTCCIKVGHNGGDSVETFNCSVRVGWGAVNAGLITAGYFTETYSCSVETNGVRPIGRCDTCNFFWTAPPAGTDTVRLYLAGLQGIEGEWGRYSELILASAEGISGAEEERKSLAPMGVAFGMRLVGENPARSGVALAYRLEGSGPGQLRAYDLAGRQVRSFAVRGSGVLRWDGRDASGLQLPEGIYFFRLEQGPRSVTCKVLLIR